MDLIKWFRSFSPLRQLALLALTAAVLCAILFAVYFMVLRKPYATLFTNMRANDAATVVGELDKKKVPYRLADGGQTIKVPADVVDRTRLDIMSQDLPIKGTVGFELFNKSDMGLTEFAQKINYQRALQGELARTIMTMDVVETARIHLALPEATIFRDDRRPSKASVTILTRGGVPLSAATVLGVQRLVAASVPELAVNDVVVLDGHGDVVSTTVDTPAGAAYDATTAPAGAQEKQAIEQYYAARLRQVLESGAAGRTVQVRVWAGYDPQDSAVDDDAARWSPATRAFPLRVTIFTDAQDPAAQDEARAVVTAVIGAAPGDSVAFSPMSAWRAAAAPLEPYAALPIAATPEPTAQATAAPSRAPDLEPTPRKPISPWTIVLALVVVGALAMALLAQRRLAPPRRLSPADHDDYAQQLKLLLEKEGSDALPTA